MKHKASKLLSVVLTSSVFVGTIRAGGGNKIPQGTWEQHLEGISVAVLLSHQNQNGSPGNTLKVYIKNNRTDLIEFLGGGEGKGIKVHYTTTGGVEVPLWQSQLSRSISNAVTGPEKFPPGDTILKMLDLTEDKAAKIRGAPIECEFGIRDPKKNKGYLIKTTARIAPYED